MFKHLLLIALLGACGIAGAQQRECFAPEHISRLKEKMARYNWTTGPTKPAVTKHRPYFPVALIKNYPVACVALAVDATGIVKEAIVYYPRSARLSRDERKEFMKALYEPAQVDGAASSSILIMSMGR